MKSQHLKPLTSLRFFAAAAIVIFHMKDILPWDRPAVLSQGVSFFFVLSGFILTYVYGKDFSVRDFYVSRVARLWPVHLFCFILVLMMVDVPATHLPHGLAIALSNLTMTQAWFPIVGVPFSFNGPSWSISCEMAFYLTFPFLVRSRRFWLLYAGAAALAIFSLAMANTALPAGAPKLFGFWPVHLIHQHPATRLLEFATGVAASRIFSAMKAPQINPTGLEIVALLALGLYWVTAESISGAIGVPAISMWYAESGGLVLFAAAITVFAWGNGYVSKLLSAKVLVILGEISFSTYMLHQIIIRAYLANDPGLEWYEAAVVILAASYGGSYLLWRYVEKPARQTLITSFRGLRSA